MTIRHIVLLALLMTSGFLVVGQVYVAIPLATDIADRFDISPSSAAFVSSAFGFSYAAGFLVFGSLSDHHGRRRVIVFGLIATALATALVGFAASFDLLLVARVIQGLAASTIPPAGLSLVAEELPPRHRVLGISLMSFAFLGAAPLAQFFAAQAEGGLPSIMLELAPLYLIGAAGLFVAANSGEKRWAAPGGTQKGQFASLLRDPGILAAWAAAATTLLGFVSFHAAVQALNAAIGVDLQALRLIGLPPLLLTFAAGPVTSRYGAPCTARIGLLLTAFSLGVVIVGTPTGFMAASAVLSAGVAFAIPGLIATVAGRSTQANRGMALAIYTFALFFGASIAPPLTQTVTQVDLVPFWVLPFALLVLTALGLTAASEPKTKTMDAE